MSRATTVYDNEIAILECIEKLQDEIVKLKKQLVREPLNYYTIDNIFQDIYATGWPGPKLSDEDIKFVRAIEAAHGIYSED